MDSGDNTRNAELDRLALLLSIFRDYVEIKNGACFFDSNRLAETLMCDLLSDLCGWGPLKNLNADNPTQPAIDLLSLDGRVGVQVTSTRTLGKVKDTITKFLSLDPRPDELYILMICGKEGRYPIASIEKCLADSGLDFTAQKNILDLGGLFNLAQSRGEARIEDAVMRLEAALGKRALSLLNGFDRTADRVLRVLTSHDLAPSSIVQVLHVDPKVPRAALTTSHGLNPYLTRPACESIAAEFNVPLDWINGHSERIGEYFGASPWRSLGDVKSLLRGVLDRYGAAQFSIVLPDDMGCPFPIGGDGTVPSTGAYPEPETPVLIFYEAKGRYGKVFVHLGMQPWDVPHHRKAAIFLGTILRDLAFASLGSFGVQWSLWPRELILETRSERLLSEIAAEYPGTRFDETDAITFDSGRWRYVDGDEDWEREFNDEYVPAIRGLVETVEEEARRDSFLVQWIAEQEIKRQIKKPAAGSSRIFGGDACDLAEMCGIPVRCADTLGVVREMTVSDARAVITGQLTWEADDLPSAIIFLDVRPA